MREGSVRAGSWRGLAELWLRPSEHTANSALLALALGTALPPVRSWPLVPGCSASPAQRSVLPAAVYRSHRIWQLFSTNP